MLLALPLLPFAVAPATAAPPALAATAAPAPDEATPEPAAPSRPWTVTVDPLTFAIGYAHVQVERRLDPHLSLYLGPSLRLFDGILPDVNGPYVGLGVEAGLRFFPWADAPSGPWLMWRGVGAALSTTDGTDQHAPGGYTSVLVGGTLIPGGRLVISGGLGLSFFAYTVGGYGVEGFLPAAHTAVGVAL